MTERKNQPQFLPFAEAQQALLNDNQIVVSSELVALADAHQRIVAQDITASVNVPNYDNSAMDGFAFCHADLATHTKLKLVGTVYAGHPYQSEWRSGECVRIMTGAPIPPGFDSVEMQENASVEDGDYVTFSSAPKLSQHVRSKGEDIRSGSVLFAQGHRLTACDIGLLASIGHNQTLVYRSLKVAVISTGDELHEPGSSVAAGGIFDSNRFSVRAILNNLGIEVIDLGIIADEPQKLQSAFQRAIELADVVISSGGVSVGEADHTKTVLESLGTMQFWKVAMKPGKPFAYGHFTPAAGDSVVKRFMGLPGNPVSAVVTLHQLAIPTLKKMAGEQVTLPTPMNLPLAQPLRKRPGRLDFMRAKLVTKPGEATQVAPLSGQGSGILSSFSRSEGYLLLAAEGGEWQAGDLVPFLPFDDVLS